MTKDEVLGYLGAEHIDYRLVEHQAVRTMEELASSGVPQLELIPKNLFVRDDKKRNYYLITLKGDRNLMLRDFEREHRTRRLSFASAEDLMKYLGLGKGSVTPLGLLNDEGHKVGFILDGWFEGKEIGIHPMVNTSTVFLSSSDLISLIVRHGNSVSWL